MGLASWLRIAIHEEPIVVWSCAIGAVGKKKEYLLLQADSGQDLTPYLFECPAFGLDEKWLGIITFRRG